MLQILYKFALETSFDINLVIWSCKRTKVQYNKTVNVYIKFTNDKIETVIAFLLYS